MLSSSTIRGIVPVSITKETISSLVLLACVAVFATQPVRADFIPLGDAANYAVLYDGLGGNQLSITNVTINGNVGVGATGTVAFSGPGAINGRLDFSAAHASQYTNTNGSNVGPTSVNYNQTNVTTDLNSLSLLSSTLGSVAGTSVSLANAATQTINEGSGVLFTSGGVTYRVFNVISVHDQPGQILTINGDGSGDVVVFNFSASANLQGDISLAGLIDDQVLWNFAGGNAGTGGPTMSLNNNASSYKLLAWHGVLLDPNGPMSVTNANLDGRVFGGDSHNMQIVSGTNINSSTSVPEPSTLLLFSVGLLGLTIVARAISSREPVS